ncbi:PAS domain-containing sensor histidine kinase [Azohydromonas lata]|uniref:histidine kinase n=1 Tax=Azohydromonas lata TaxID=45677 RepID=A0ABU5IGY1_9BURK|nr:PAS domain-containing protein [Azohydromonas lata]MDZ5458395.1 PAS domain-containing protein [Azohydromonas lata]
MNRNALTPGPPCAAADERAARHGHFEVPALGQRSRAEQMLAQDKERLELALDAAQLGLWEWSLRSGRLWFSEAVLRITGLTREALEADHDCWRHLVDPQDLEAIWAMDEAAREGRGFHAEYRLLRPDGGLRWVANDARCVCDAAGKPQRMVGTLADVTARKQVEEALRLAHDELEQRVQERTAALELANTQLANEVAERGATDAQIRELLDQLVNAEEDERRRLARELHDSLGQHLTALTLGLRAVLEDPALPRALRERLAQLREVTRRLDDDVDRLSYQLRPALLDDLGLNDALRELASSWAEDSGIAVDLHTRGLRGRRFDAALETTVYRVVQEALTNVRKHAQASRVGLIVELQDGELRAIVEDDGRGMAVEEELRPRAGPGRRLGMRGMAERARQAGGRLDLETEAGQGTTVYLSIPLQPEGS